VEVLRIDANLRKDNAERARLLNAADVAFLCLPDAAAREAAALVTTRAPASSTPARPTAPHPAGSTACPNWRRGQREAIRAGKRISNPGCHATAFILLLRPLVDAGLVPATLPVTATSITGYSGGGKKMIEQYQQAGHRRRAALTRRGPTA
jgi:N-acetyl-gamma-glutamyl-phosphate reductase